MRYKCRAYSQTPDSVYFQPAGIIVPRGNGVKLKIIVILWESYPIWYARSKSGKLYSYAILAPTHRHIPNTGTLNATIPAVLHKMITFLRIGVQKRSFGAPSPTNWRLSMRLVHCHHEFPRGRGERRSPISPHPSLMRRHIGNS